MGSLHLSFHGPGIYTIWSSFLNLLGQLEPNLAVMMFVRSFTKVLIFSWSGFKKMATMDHSWFWLIETLIIFSEATIPNSLLVCTNNLFEIYYKKFSIHLDMVKIWPPWAILVSGGLKLWNIFSSTYKLKWYVVWY